MSVVKYLQWVGDEYWLDDDDCMPEWRVVVSDEYWERYLRIAGEYRQMQAELIAMKDRIEEEQA